MIPLLLCLVLLIGLLQSFFELKKDNGKKSKFRIKKTLSLLYICGFIIGIIVIILHEGEANKVNSMIEGIFSSVGKIDSIDKRLMGVLEIKDSLIVQYENVNARLSKQLELETKAFEEKSPQIVFMNYDINWEGSDSTSYSLCACIRNLGKRSASIIGGNGFVLFVDKKNKPAGSIDIPGNNIKSILEPNEVEGMRFCYFSHDIKNFQSIKSLTNFAIIYLKVLYKDIAMNKTKKEDFYMIWIPDKEFGGPKDWQMELARKWGIENKKIDMKK